MGVRVILNGKTIDAIEGQSVGAFLLDQDERITRTTRFEGRPRGMFCGIGICFDCLVTIDGATNQRACLTSVANGMSIQTQHGAGTLQ